MGLGSMTSPWTDEAEDGAATTLAAALAFVDAYESEAEREDPKQEHARIKAEPPSPDENMAATRRKRAWSGARPYYLRQQEEVKMLKKQAEELEATLGVLKRLRARQSVGRKRLRGRTTELKTTSSTEGSRASSGLELWKDVAKLRRRQRQDAEMDNECLRKLVQQQRAVLDAVQQFFQQMQELETQCLPRHLLTPVTRPTMFPDSAVVFDHLARCMPTLLAQAGSVFLDPRLDVLENALVDIRMRDDQQILHQVYDDSSATIDALAARVVPFQVEAAAQVMWKVFSTPSPHSDAMGLEIHRSENTVRQQVHGCAHRDGDYLEFYGRIVIQRYVVADHVVIVSANLAEPVCFSGTPIHGVLLRTVDWTVIEKARNPRLAPRAAQIQKRHMSSMVVLDHKAESRRIAQVLDAFFATGTKMHVEFGMQTIDNRLLEHSVQERTTTTIT